ncbi:hypothetical protein PIB30_081269 [Stylosanthes scabra]|uniref:Uncharacterized protein n=1 Tax=Stylosanthes scabra TaxID=79078 RepID=A0ABU6YP96_9FABA|nr:hypothetical protein [Stylosanthes scabra]
MRKAQRRTESQITHLTKLLTKVANQVAVNSTTSSPPPNPNPLPSQPLPNPKGGINMVQKWEKEENKKKTRGEEEDEKEEVNEGEAKEESEAEEEEETFFVAMMFEKSKVDKLEIPPKCEDPGPCLVTCEIRGKSNDVFTTADLGVVSILGIAENVLVKVGGLTILCGLSRHKGY